MNVVKKSLIFMVVFLLSGITAYAGNINEHEQRVIDVASTPVTHNGKEYIAKEQYILRLTAYLNQDNVDLTEEDANLAIDKFYANIETGIKDGYMEEVKSSKPDGGNKPDTHDKEEGNEPSSDVEDENNVSSIENEENQDIDTLTDAADTTDMMTESVEQEVILSEEEIARLQKERALVAAVIEKYSLEEEEVNAYEELEIIEQQMGIENEKDYSNAEPYQQGISIGTIAIAIVIVVAIIMVCIILWHKNKRYRR